MVAMLLFAGYDSPPMRATNIYFIGPMGAGKTTIGRRVARELGLRFIDLDRRIETQTGASVELVFEIEGEAGFRKRETRALQQVSRKKGILLATGGGVILSRRNRKILRSTGFVVHLQTTVDQQIKRLKRDRQRPLLRAPNRRQRLEEMAQTRNPLYAELADLEVTTGNRTLNVAATQIAEEIRSAWQN